MSFFFKAGKRGIHSSYVFFLNFHYLSISVSSEKNKFRDEIPSELGLCTSLLEIDMGEYFYVAWCYHFLLREREREREI